MHRKTTTRKGKRSFGPIQRSENIHYIENLKSKLSTCDEDDENFADGCDSVNLAAMVFNGHCEKRCESTTLYEGTQIKRWIIHINHGKTIQRGNKEAQRVHDWMKLY